MSTISLSRISRYPYLFNTEKSRKDRQKVKILHGWKVDQHQLLHLPHHKICAIIVGAAPYWYRHASKNNVSGGGGINLMNTADV